jgi:hypothetical protein
MDNRSLEQLRTERDKLNAQIAAVEAEAEANYNSQLDDVQSALERFAEEQGWPLTTSGRKNAALLDLGFPDRTVTIALHYNEDRYPAGSTAVSVTDQASGVTASFDGVPVVTAMTSLVQGWLTADRADEK